MAEWISVRQQAGDYIKECRYVRPWHRAAESPGERADKNKIINQTKTTFRRKPAERAELFVGLLGMEATFYTLTFDDAHLPRNYADARRIWKNFMNRLKKAKGESSTTFFAWKPSTGTDVGISMRYFGMLILQKARFSGFGEMDLKTMRSQAFAKIGRPIVGANT